ncbi:MAG: hypothetical protein SFU25_11015 [Candidatus Caenarcaniphilales bacterium]|nr:hypothetical protein [Candidatus Caenarcaniphilales bacterium]
MNFQTPTKPRYKKTETSNELVITIPSRNNWFLIIFVLVWLSGWVFGGIMAILKIFASLFIEPENFFSPENMFLTFWLCGWAAGLAVAIYGLFWNLSGKEEIKISSVKFEIERKTPIWSSTKKFYVSQIKSFRTLHPGLLSILFPSNYPYGHYTESIAFDYGAETIQFGLDLDEAEAKLIVQDIQNKFPKLCES